MDDQSPVGGEIPVLDYAGTNANCHSRPWWRFTVLEWLMFAGLAGLLGLFCIPIFFSRRCGDASLLIAQYAVKPNGWISAAIENFKFDHGRCPNQLAELINPPQSEGAEGQPLPYLYFDIWGVQDPWGQTYQYRCPAARSAEGFDLWSCGPNGISGDADDIGNW